LRNRDVLNSLFLFTQDEVTISSSGLENVYHAVVDAMKKRIVLLAILQLEEQVFEAFLLLCDLFL
jgi:hypothetical protein